MQQLLEQNALRTAAAVQLPAPAPAPAHEIAYFRDGNRVAVGDLVEGGGGVARQGYSHSSHVTCHTQLVTRWLLRQDAAAARASGGEDNDDDVPQQQVCTDALPPAPSPPWNGSSMQSSRVCLFPVSFFFFVTAPYYTLRQHVSHIGSGCGQYPASHLPCKPLALNHEHAPPLSPFPRFSTRTHRVLQP